MEFIGDTNRGELKEITNVVRCLGAFTTCLVALKKKIHVNDSIDVILLVETMNDEGDIAKETWGWRSRLE